RGREACSSPTFRQRLRLASSRVVLRCQPHKYIFIMADLDDFFAKKDRKKGKGKKFTTTDEIAKRLEETGKKVEKTKKEKAVLPSQTQGQGEEDQGSQVQEDDEWKEFEEEKKDYTGLKIGNLQINEGDGDIGEGEEEADQEMEENEAGEMVPKRKVQSGPWKMMNQPQPTAIETPEPPVVEKRPETISSNSYVPPHLRGQHKEPAHSSPGAKSKAAPDISSEEYFPSLSAAKSIEPSGARGRRRHEEESFEEVRNSKSHSSRYSDMATKMSGGTAGPKLNLGNKFGALSQDQS
ncbi:hypothetical protein L9F63_020012, partial [Diploptera punctata]